MQLSKYSFGIGDRFAHQGKAQLNAIVKAKALGIEISPVWNKSNREHTIIGTTPEFTRKEADEAVKALHFTGSYFVDADHINLSTVDKFIASSDFFTLDVADYIGEESSEAEIEKFVSENKKYIGKLQIPTIAQPFVISEDLLRTLAKKFLFATKEAAKIYNHIATTKGNTNFITEVSMDEVNEPQTPVEMFFILKMLADNKIPAQTIAPKFTGRFNKGVDYVGDVNQFRTEFEQDLLVIDFAVKEFGLPLDLKLSIHSGSDKFAIYPIMGELIQKYDKGIHVKTAGTTWLEEVIGISLGDAESLNFVKKLYTQALSRFEELSKPYSTVIDIDHKKLPSVAEVNQWTGEKYANTLRHDASHSDYNIYFRQLIHVSFRVAAENIEEYNRLLVKNEKIIAEQVSTNLFERHIKRLFGL